MPESRATPCARHRASSSARVSARRDGHVLVVMVQDDGRGGADPERGTGLIGLTDRVEALRGSLSISSSGDAGTLLRAEFPLARGESNASK